MSDVEFEDRVGAMATGTRSRASRAMDAYADGDNEAFGIVYNELAPRLYSYVQRMRGSNAGNEDILQQVFLNMHQARSKFARGARVEPWAYAIARHVVIDWSRRSGQKEHPVGGEPGLLRDSGGTPEVSAVTFELECALRKGLQLVPEKLREAFLLVRVEGLSTAEAAQVLGTTSIAVKLRAHRAGIMLRRDLLHFRFDGGTG